jgi:hypothetical protein
MKAALALTTLCTIALNVPLSAAQAQLFDQQEVDSARLVAVAAPYGDRAHQLRIIQQASNAQSCWSELGSSPVMIDPLLNQFDYTNICNVSTDSNGFSIRMANQDLGLVYNLRVVARNNDLLLIGTPALGIKAPELEIGRANGYTDGFAKIQLNPGWRFTQRAFSGKRLGHFYLTSDHPLENWMATPSTPSNAEQPATPAMTPSPVSPTVASPIPPPISVPPIAVPAEGAIPITVPPPDSAPGLPQPVSPQPVSPQPPGTAADTVVDTLPGDPPPPPPPLPR